MSVEPKSYKRYCPKNHDTWFFGRAGSSHTCKECQRQRSRRTEAEKRARKMASEYVPNLSPYREARGFTATQVAWEAGMEMMLYQKLEACERMATYEQRVRIYRALVVLVEREREALEMMRERERRMLRAGLC
jgi:hypothetical protein